MIAFVARACPLLPGTLRRVCQLIFLIALTTATFSPVCAAAANVEQQNDLSRRAVKATPPPPTATEHPSSVKDGVIACPAPGLPPPSVPSVAQPTSTTITSTLNPSTFGQTVTFTISITLASCGAVANTSVSLYDGAALLTTLTAANSGILLTASYSTSSLSAGTHTITAVYVGDSNEAGSSAFVNQDVISSVLVVTPVNVSIAEHSLFNGSIATFTDNDLAATAASFTATIAWGDGTMTAGTITGSSGSFTVTGQHTYADEGSFADTISVSETAPGSSTATAAGSATVSEADLLSGTLISFSAKSGIAFTGAVATFTDTNTGNVAGDFTAAINWGDGTTNVGTVTGSAGLFQVSGTHTYTSAGAYSVVVTLSDDAPGTATASASGTESVSAAAAIVPQPAPALGPWGLLALMAILAIAGLCVAPMRNKS